MKTYAKTALVQVSLEDEQQRTTMAYLPVFQVKWIKNNWFSLTYVREYEGLCLVMGDYSCVQEYCFQPGWHRIKEVYYGSIKWINSHVSQFSDEELISMQDSLSWTLAGKYRSSGSTEEQPAQLLKHHEQETSYLIKIARRLGRELYEERRRNETNTNI